MKHFVVKYDGKYLKTFITGWSGRVEWTLDPNYAIAFRIEDHSYFHLYFPDWERIEATPDQIKREEDRAAIRRQISKEKRDARREASRKFLESLKEKKDEN